MDGIVEKIMRLESAKHKALVLIDAPAYKANLREQMRLLAISKKTGCSASVERLLVLSQLITLNSRLLQNLTSTTPLFALSKSGHAAKRRASTPAAARRGVTISN